jgi:DNA-binding CsgD family transcriptional regulator
VDPREMEGWLGSRLPAAGEDAPELTAREREVLRMIADGAANKVIAWKLGVSEHTVKFHVASILAKLGAATRTEAVSIGMRRGLVPL